VSSHKLVRGRSRSRNLGVEVRNSQPVFCRAPFLGCPTLLRVALSGEQFQTVCHHVQRTEFQPATIHPKANEVADYGFHAHSAFDGARAEFIFTTLYNGRVLVQKDQPEEQLSPIPEGKRAKGIWKGKGKPGEHMLQIRAWRGVENGGDWVVAWSPDIVDVVK
jgi:hypothetical protein